MWNLELVNELFLMVSCVIFWVTALQLPKRALAQGSHADLTAMPRESKCCVVRMILLCKVRLPMMCNGHYMQHADGRMLGVFTSLLALPNRLSWHISGAVLAHTSFMLAGSTCRRAELHLLWHHFARRAFLSYCVVVRVKWLPVCHGQPRKACHSILSNAGFKHVLPLGMVC